MAFKAEYFQGKEIADGYSRTSVPESRWADTWDVFKKSFSKMFLINLFMLITFSPAIGILFYRLYYINGILGTSYPFNSSISFPFYPNMEGLVETVFFNADLVFYALLVASGIIAALGISGGAYCVKKMLQTHGAFSIKDFFHGIKTGYLKTVLPVILFLACFYCCIIARNYMNIAFATNGNKGGTVTLYVFAILFTVILGMYFAWLLSTGVSYRAKYTHIIKNSLSLFFSTIISTVFMAAFALLPVWIYLLGTALGGIPILGFLLKMAAYVILMLFGFSVILLCWMSYSQWVFDAHITPAVKVEKKKKARDEAAPEVKDEKTIAMELLAAGKSDLASRPMMPVSATQKVKSLGESFTREDILRVQTVREKVYKDADDYEKAHLNDPVYAEYNKMFADREKALKTDGKKKNKRVSAENLLK